MIVDNLKTQYYIFRSTYKNKEDIYKTKSGTCSGTDLINIIHSMFLGSNTIYDTV